MTSSINPTKPEQGNALTADMRANFLAAKNEIESLQTGLSNIQLTPGAQGPAGPIGPTGLTGPAGPAGAAGAAGAKGNNGAVGPTGPIGPTGLTGPAGPTGAAGAAGAVGPQGPAGPTNNYTNISATVPMSATATAKQVILLSPQPAAGIVPDVLLVLTCGAALGGFLVGDKVIVRPDGALGTTGAPTVQLQYNNAQWSVSINAIPRLMNAAAASSALFNINNTWNAQVAWR